MTAMVFSFEADRVLVAMDSLVSSPEGPLIFTTKLFPLPHAQAAMCGTGSLDVLLEWHACIQRRVLARNVLALDRLATKFLPEIAARVPSAESPDRTTTVYQFGWHPDEKRFIGFAYRSRNGFASEPLGYGLGMKPPIPLTEDLGSSAGQLIQEIMRRQRRADDARPVNERVGIGGEIHVLEMNPSTQFLWTHYRFDDADEMFAQMLDADGMTRTGDD